MSTSESNRCINYTLSRSVSRRLDEGYGSSAPYGGSMWQTDRQTDRQTNTDENANHTDSIPASAGKAKAGMVHFVSGWTRGVQVKLWDPLRTHTIPERLRGVITTRRYTNPHLPLPLPAELPMLCFLLVYRREICKTADFCHPQMRMSSVFPVTVSVFSWKDNLVRMTFHSRYMRNENNLIISVKVEH